MAGVNLINTYKYVVKEVQRVWGLETVEVFHRPEDYERKVLCSIIIDLGQPNSEHELFQKVYELASNTLPYHDLMTRKQALQEKYEEQIQKLEQQIQKLEQQIQELEEKIKDLEVYKIHFELEYKLRHSCPIKEG